MTACHYCGKAVDPQATGTHRRVVGWERVVRVRATGTKGGSDIYCREVIPDTFACWDCIRRIRDGVAPLQGTLA